MDVIDIAKRSLGLIWRNKRWLFFGIFVASAGAGGRPHRVGHHGGALPGWLPALIIAGVVVALGVLVLRVVSEGALIEGVCRAERGERFGIRAGLSAGWQRFLPVAGVKLLMGVAMAAAGLGVVAPLGLGFLGLYPKLVGALATAALALVGVPVLLTLYFIYIYALRVTVIEKRPALAAIRAARTFLHGRLRNSLKLMVTAGVGAAALTAACLVALVPAALAGGAAYFAAGLVAAVVTGVVLGVPVALTAVGALGVFRSSVWTLGYLSERGAA